MNRQQRRSQSKGDARIEYIPVENLVTPHQMTLEDVRMIIPMRLADNVEATQHPFHHLTANGVIVKPDPTLEYLLGRLPEEERKAIRNAWLHRCSPLAPQAFPVNRKYYGIDPYEKQN